MGSGCKESKGRYREMPHYTGEKTNTKKQSLRNRRVKLLGLKNLEVGRVIADEEAMLRSKEVDLDEWQPGKRAHVLTTKK